MTRLSVNINKFATLRNARGANMPNIIKTAMDCERFGAQGITVHPRPDERHIKYQDVRNLKPILTTEFNIEGNPIKAFQELVIANTPNQVTMVPDSENVITSNTGWDTIKNKKFLQEMCKLFKSYGIRTSIFIDPDVEMIKHAADCGCDRVELYTESYAKNYSINKELSIAKYYKAAEQAKKSGLGLNAGHDLNLDNLKYFCETIPWIDEVSIGHALVCEALYLGLDNTINLYLKELNNF
ncbi:MAG: pyridoxine 5'-phosphate synthase [Bacteroidales bacterium]